MGTIHLSKDGIRRTNDYNPDSDEYVSELVDSLLPYLRDEVTLSDDYTLEDLFKILEKEVDKFDIIFSSDLGHCPLSLYIEDINEDAVKVDKDGMEFLEVHWICTCEDYEARGYKELNKEIQISADFHGWGIWPIDENSPYPDDVEGGFAIEFTPLSELKHYPLRIKTLTKIYLDDGTYETDAEGNTNLKILFEGKKCFSVFEFLSAILYEISWGGSPEDRDEKMAEIDSDYEDLKKRIDSGDTSCFKSFDELKLAGKVIDLLESEDFLEELADD